MVNFVRTLASMTSQNIILPCTSGCLVFIIDIGGLVRFVITHLFLVNSSRLPATKVEINSSEGITNMENGVWC